MASLPPTSGFGGVRGGGAGPWLSLLPQQGSEWSEVEVEVFFREAELLPELVHPLVQLHEGVAEALDLLVVEAAGLHAPEGFPLHHSPEEVDDRQDEARETAFDVLGVGLYAEGGAIH